MVRNFASKLDRTSVGVSVPIDSRQFGGQGVAPGHWRRKRRFIGVQANRNINLGRVIALEGAQIVTNRNHFAEATEPFLPLKNMLHNLYLVRMPTSLSGALAELTAIADLIERQRERVAGIAEPFLGTDREDVITTVHEAERQLLMSSRSLRRAIKTLEK